MFFFVSVRSSYKNDEEIPVEPKKAINLKEKFENWSAEIDRQNKKNSSFDEDEQFVPHIDTTKNLRAKFESIQEEPKQPEKPIKKINRFVVSNYH